MCDVFVCLSMYLPTLGASRFLFQGFTIRVPTPTTFCSVCLCTVHVSQSTLLWILLAVISWTCLLVACDEMTLFSYSSPHLSAFLSFIQVFCLVVAQASTPLGYIVSKALMLSELMLHFCIILVSSYCLVKPVFPLYLVVRSHKEWPDRRPRWASV